MTQEQQLVDELDKYMPAVFDKAKYQTAIMFAFRCGFVGNNIGKNVTTKKGSSLFGIKLSERAWRFVNKIKCHFDKQHSDHLFYFLHIMMVKNKPNLN